jgi:hypothetical protein
MGELREDIEAAKKQMSVRVGGGREIKKLVEHLWEGERVERMTTGYYGNGNGLIVLTDRRLLFIQDGMLSHKTEDFPLDKLSSVQWSSGIALGSITVFSAGNKAVIQKMNKVDGKAMVDLVRGRMNDGAQAPAAAPVATPASDPFADIERLAELRDKGIITEDEFTAKKQALLGL